MAVGRRYWPREDFSDTSNSQVVVFGGQQNIRLPLFRMKIGQMICGE